MYGQLYSGPSGGCPEGGCDYPLTVYANGKGTETKEFSGENLIQGDPVFLGQKNVSHRKYRVRKYATAKSGVTYDTLWGPITGAQEFFGEYRYGRACIDARQLSGSYALPFGDNHYHHNVITKYRGHVCTYTGTYHRSFGNSVRPTWRIYMIDTRPDGTYKYRVSEPSNQGYNSDTTSWDTPMGTPHFTKEQEQQILNDEAKFEASNNYQPMTEEKNIILDDYFPDLTPMWPDNDFPVYAGELAAEAIDSIEYFTGNGAALISDIIHLNDAFASSLVDIKGMSSGKVKAFANAYLSVHYGYKLLLSDIQELISELNRYLDMYRYTSVHAMRRMTIDGIEYTQNLQIFYELFGNHVSDWTKLARLLDLAPSLHSAWDSIPFSFVVDWVLNIGDLAMSIDNFYTLSQEHKVIGSGQSLKKVRRSNQICKTDKSYMSVIQSTYCRHYFADWLPIPTVTLTAGLPDIGHAGEATALIIKKKT